MYVDRELLKFQILSDCETREPLCILFRNIDVNSSREVAIFVDLLEELVNEGFLECHLHVPEKEHRFLRGEEFSTRLHSFINETSARNASLISTSNYSPFEFIQAEKGTLCQSEKYASVQVKAKTIIDKIEQYHVDKGKYPPNLTSLYPDYLSGNYEPKEIYGSWWYQVSDSLDNFILGYYSFYGRLTVFNTTNNRWEEFV